MNADYLYKEDTEIIISAFYEVYHALGTGFLERVYQNALYYELMERGLKCSPQKHIDVRYKDKVVGDYVADMVVNDRIILELKAVENLCPSHEYQLVNYLKATGIEVGLLLNFGQKPQVKRKIFSKKESQCSSLSSVSSAFKKDIMEDEE